MGGERFIVSEVPLQPLYTKRSGSSRSFTAIRKDAGLCCGSRLRKGEVFAYVQLPENPKDLKNLKKPLNHLIPLWAFSRLWAWCVCEHDPLDELEYPIEDPLATHREPSALYCWILEILDCNLKGHRALLRIPSTEGRSVCLCWKHSKSKGT